ncbi:hypothetical protein PGC35_21230 [Psychrobacillus sp. PGGUH221]|uniref:hypothetical protein n=1 Tax=Psychrobacillus sp. PGGUH221 TaxID=3020058 RepID=UPI0035C6B43D
MKKQKIGKIIEIISLALLFLYILYPAGYMNNVKLANTMLILGMILFLASIIITPVKKIEKKT